MSLFADCLFGGGCGDGWRILWGRMCCSTGLPTAVMSYGSVEKPSYPYSQTAFSFCSFSERYLSIPQNFYCWHLIQNEPQGSKLHAIAIAQLQPTFLEETPELSSSEASYHNSQLFWKRNRIHYCVRAKSCCKLQLWYQYVFFQCKRRSENEHWLSQGKLYSRGPQEEKATSIGKGILCHYNVERWVWNNIRTCRECSDEKLWTMGLQTRTFRAICKEWTGRTFPALVELILIMQSVMAIGHGSPPGRWDNASSETLTEINDMKLNNKKNCHNIM